MLKENEKINKVTVEEIGDPKARTGNCCGCGQVGHFFEDCTNPNKFEYRKENHPYPPNKGSPMDWHLNIGAHGETTGLMGTILNHLQKQEKEKRGLMRKYKKMVKLNEELQASAQESKEAKTKTRKRKPPVELVQPPKATVLRHLPILPPLLSSSSQTKTT